MPLVINQLRQNAVQFFGMDKSEFTVTKRARDLSLFVRDKRIVPNFQFIHGLARVVHVQTDDHDPFSVFFNPFGHRTVRRCRFHQLQTHLADPVTGHANFFRSIFIGIIRPCFAQQGFPYLPGRIQVPHRNTYVVYFVYFHRALP